MLTTFLGQSVTVGTTQNYLSGIKKWKEYLSSLGTANSPGEYMEKVSDNNEKAKRIVLFMAYLYMNNGMRDEQIK